MWRIDKDHVKKHSLLSHSANITMAAPNVPSFTLNDGHEMPGVGMGYVVLCTLLWLARIAYSFVVDVGWVPMEGST